MTTSEYEQRIAQFYLNLGYSIEFTKKSYDYGIDIIAANSKQKIGIQAKMYNNGRQVNYQEIMYTFAGKALYGCDCGILLTSGTLMKDAKTVADKLNIAFKEKFVPDLSLLEEIKSGSAENSLLNEIWTKLIIPLKGQEILTKTHKKGNFIVEVNENYLERISSNNKKSKIKYEVFEVIISRFLENKSITRNEINQNYRNLVSSVIFSFLSTFPYVAYNDEQKMLILNKEKFLKSLMAGNFY